MAKENSRQAAQPGLCDFKFTSEIREFLKASGFKVLDLPKFFNVVPNGDPGFDDIGIRQDFFDDTKLLQWTKSKKKSLIGSGELEEGWGIAGPSSESRLGLYIETQHSLLL